MLSKSSLNIRFFSGRDWVSQDLIEEISEFEKKYFDYPWPFSSWGNLAKNSNLYLLGVAYNLSGEIQAQLLFQLIESDEMAHLLKILVAPKKRSQKIGYHLIHKSFELLKGKSISKIFLEVEKENKIALDFYKKLGFSDLHELKHFYGRERHGRSMILLMP